MTHFLHRSITAGLTALSLAAAPVSAESPLGDGVVAPGLLSDADFYQLATCGAQPGGDCQAPALRWQKSALTIAIDMGDTSAPPRFEVRMTKALVEALAQINAAGAGISLRFTKAPTADVIIRPTTLVEGAVLTEIPDFSGAGIMGVGYMTVWSDSDNTILKAVILISTTITEDDLPSVMLEEVTQSLGFLYDIEGHAYEGVSILSQTSNATVTIAGQDATLLRLHYPRP